MGAEWRPVRGDYDSRRGVVKRAAMRARAKGEYRLARRGANLNGADETIEYL
jgi:hypothetical protein